MATPASEPAPTDGNTREMAEGIKFGPLIMREGRELQALPDAVLHFLLRHSHDEHGRHHADLHPQ